MPATARADEPDQPPHILPNGSPRHPDRIAPAVWRDIDDTAAMERDTRGRAHQKSIAGFRVIDPLTRLPCEPEHHKAAARLRRDCEKGCGAMGGGSDAGRVDGGGRRDVIADELEARRRFEDACAAVGKIGCGYLLPVVISGWTVADLVKCRGGNAMTVQGRVMAALDRLAESYGLANQRATVAVAEAPWEMVGYVPVGTALPAERVGRPSKS